MRTRTNIQVRFNDIDMAGHVHNAVYLSYFEQARMDLFRGFMDRENDWRKNGLILARNEVDYRAPVHLSDEVIVECWCSKVGGKSFDLGYELFVIKGEERALHCEGRSVMVCFDYETKSTVAVPERWRTELLRWQDVR